MSRFNCGARIEKYKGDKNRPVLVLFNHVTGYDQFFVSLAFRQHIYYVAMEDLFSNGFVSGLIRFLVGPIPIKKHTTDLKAMKDIVTCAKEGGSIGIAPEGNRTYSGRTCEMKRGITSMCKLLKMPVVLYHIDGGYGVWPRWGGRRKGRIDCTIKRVLEPSEYLKWSDDELYDVIKKELSCDEARSDRIFKSRHSAEYLERAMYICPFCGFAEFESKGDIIRCKSCDRKIRYGQNTELIGVGFDFPYRYVADWYDHQNEFVNGTLITVFKKESVFTDTAAIFDVKPAVSRKLIDRNARITLFGDRIEVTTSSGNIILPFDKIIGAACVGDNRLNVECDGKLYLIKGDKRFNPLKYVNFYYRYSNIKKGEGNGKFLGL